MVCNWKRVVTGVLCALMVFGNIPAQQLEAAAVNEENQTFQNEQKQDTKEDISIVTDSQSEYDENSIQNLEKIQEIENDKQKNEQELLSGQGEKLNYFYVESPYLESPADENIVVSWGDGTENVSAMNLVCEKEDGTTSEWTYNKKENELYLFSKSFTEEESGTYCFTAIKYTLDNVEYIINLSDLEIQAEFGVNKEYDGYEPYSENVDDVSIEDVEASVITIDDDNIENAEQIVQETLDESVDVDSEESEQPLYSRQAMMSTRNRENVVVAVDPGHGGSDPGASNATYGANEKTLCLKIAKYLKEELESYGGVSVVLTRESDVSLGLKERVDIAASKGADLLVSIHLNAFNGNARGAEVYYPNQNYDSEIGVQGKDLAQKIQSEIVKLGLSDRGIKDRTCVEDKYDDGSLQDYYGIIRHSKLAGFPGVIIEHAFIDNNSDYLNYLSTDEKLKKLGVADATGIANYLGLSKGVSVSINDINSFDGTARIQTSGFGKGARLKIWNAGNWKEYNALSGNESIDFNINQYNNARGTYYIEAYNSNGQVIYNESFYISKDPSCNITITPKEEGEIYEAYANFSDMPVEVRNIQFATWSVKNGQDDIVWYNGTQTSNGRWTAQVDINKHKTTGTYNVHVYATLANGTMRFLGASTFEVAKPQILISASDKNGRETQYLMKASNAESLGLIRNVQFATWSADGGQDDIIWYSGTRNSLGEWTATADISRHRSSGTYNVHVYATLANGTMKFLGLTTFEVTNPTFVASATNYQKEAGTFDVVISNINSPSGVNKVQVPVWCESDRSDIKWYDAQKQSDGRTYKVTVNISNHKYAVGEYKIHTYLTAGNGIVVGVAAANQKVEMPEVTIESSNINGKETQYELKVENAEMLGIVRNVQFATWSAEGGQDDIVWYSGTRNSSGEWTATADINRHKTAGIYNVHVYAILANGTMKFLGKTTFEVTRPTFVTSVTNYQKEAGTFDVVISNINSPSGVNKIQVPVWCASDQSDIKWYDAKKQSDGKTYKVTVNMSNHNYAVGEYKVHTYITAGNGIVVGVAAANQKVEMPEVTIESSNINGKETQYELKVENAEMLGIVRNVQFATWSSDGGQDDIIWYSGMRNSLGEWTATADISRHRSSGTYNVHVYATLANGTMKFLGLTTFEVTNPTFVASATNYQKEAGTFDVVISNINSPSGVNKVQVPVWCKSDRSDIKWYDAQKQSDGRTYKATVIMANHSYDISKYTMHSYLIAKNGVVVSKVVESLKTDDTILYAIMGDTTVSVEQMIRFYQSSGNIYPSSELSVGGAPTLESFCQMYIEEAKAEGVRAEVAFAQAMKETGWLRYGGIVQISQFNFAGIGALDGNAGGNCASFSDVRTGIRAQIQHLKAYGSTEKLVNPQVDPRFHLVKRGVAPYVEWLGQKENPTGAGWATSSNYGYDIVKLINKMKLSF